MTEYRKGDFMCQSNYLEISREALRRNAAAVRDAVQVPIIGMLKCNGYGVTIREAAEAWQAAGVTMFGVSRPEEARELRQLGFREEVLLLSPVADLQTLTEMTEYQVILTVSGFENARFYSLNAPQYPVRVHVAVDTGMGRFGIRWNDMEQLKKVYYLPGLSFEGIFSHFSCAFEAEYGHTKIQLVRFLSVTDALISDGYPIGMRHIANSCAALRFPETRLDAVRIGSALVGRLPVSVPVALEEIGVFKARIIARKYLLAGDTTGYGSCCRIRKNTKAAVVALGREDGFGWAAAPDRLGLRNLAANIYHLLRDWLHPPCVVYNGVKLTVIGRIGNQFTLFDAGDLPIQPGDMVEWNGNLMGSTCERRFV